MIIGLFLIFFGTFFGGIPLLFFLTEINNPQFLLEENCWFLLIFVVIGLIVFLIGIYQIFIFFKHKKIARIGSDAIGHFIDGHSNTSVNGSPLFYIVFSFKNNLGEEITVKSPSKYSYDEVEFYRLLENFAIKYLGKDATIVEPFSYSKLENLTKNSNLSFAPKNDIEQNQFSQEIPKTIYYECKYCGNPQTETGKCKNCGANISSHNIRKDN